MVRIEETKRRNSCKRRSTGKLVQAPWIILAIFFLLGGCVMSDGELSSTERGLTEAEQMEVFAGERMEKAGQTFQSLDPYGTGEKAGGAESTEKRITTPSLVDERSMLGERAGERGEAEPVGLKVNEEPAAYEKRATEQKAARKKRRRSLLGEEEEGLLSPASIRRPSLLSVE